MSAKAKVFTDEYRAKVVELSYQRNNIRELADELGIRVDLIYKWRTFDRRKNGLGISLAPRIKNLKKQALYAFEKPKSICQ